MLIEELKEQIGFSIDQCHLLEMQEKKDQTRIDQVASRFEKLLKQYMEISNDEFEKEIETIEQRVISSMQEELEKRQEILLVIQKKESLLEDLILNIEPSSILMSKIEPFLSVICKEIDSYQEDVELVQIQLNLSKEADKKEVELNREKERLLLEKNMIFRSQIPYEELNQKILSSYRQLLKEADMDPIDFSRISSKKKMLLDKQTQFKDILELAQNTRNAETYQTAYQKRLQENRLEIDQLEEQTFIHLFQKFMKLPVSNYEDLKNRTNSIQAIVNSRKAQVEKLYQEDVVSESYITIASKIDHSEITHQLKELEQLKFVEKSLENVEQEFEGLRVHIKGYLELEDIFYQKAIQMGRNPVKQEVPKVQIAESDVIFTDDYEGYEELQPELEVQPEVQLQSEIQNKLIPIKMEVLKSEPASPNLLQKISSGKDWILTQLKKLGRLFSQQNSKTNVFKIFGRKDAYSPSIGDKIELKRGAKIYSNASRIFNKEFGMDAKKLGLAQELFVTRGMILDLNGNLLLGTTEYGINLQELAFQNGLENYKIALGCSFGDEYGQFIPVLTNQVNPLLEKGWVDADDSSIILVEKVKNMKKEEIVK